MQSVKLNERSYNSTIQDIVSISVIIKNTIKTHVTSEFMRVWVLQAPSSALDIWDCSESLILEGTPSLENDAKLNIFPTFLGM